jgi:two-component system C4-dicarboxylate transport response regulator DctD
MASLLLVDDDADLRALLAELLEMAGHDVTTACNGVEGLRALDVRFPQVVVSDLEMPLLDGAAMVYRMFIDDVGRENIPIIMVSAAPTLTAVAAAIGTPYFLTKPFPVAALLAMVDRVLAAPIPPRPRSMLGEPRA